MHNQSHCFIMCRVNSTVPSCLHDTGGVTARNSGPCAANSTRMLMHQVSFRKLCAHVCSIADSGTFGRPRQAPGMTAEEDPGEREDASEKNIVDEALSEVRNTEGTNGANGFARNIYPFVETCSEYFVSRPNTETQCMVNTFFHGRNVMATVSNMSLYFNNNALIKAELQMFLSMRNCSSKQTLFIKTA